MIRLVLILLFLVIFLIVTIPFVFVTWLIGKKWPKLRDRLALNVVQFAFNVITFLTGARIKYIGLENVPKDQTVLYIGNHQSYFDIVFTYKMVPNPTGYIAKINMAKVPLLSTWMRLLHCLFLDRNDVRQGFKTILSGIEQIKSGTSSIAIFPEGTRNPHPDELLPFKEGSFKLSEKSKCPIIPIAITGASNIWEDHLPWIKPADVIIQYGKPIYPDKLEGDDKKFIGAYVRSIIEKMYIENKELL